MSYELRQWPGNVYPGECAEFPDAQADIDVALRALQRDGPQSEEFSFKTLGKAKGYLWQINLKVRKKQIRILYAPYNRTMIIVFHIHKKSSPQEQQRAYEKAMRRKSQADQIIQFEGMKNVRPLAIH